MPPRCEPVGIWQQYASVLTSMEQSQRRGAPRSKHGLFNTIIEVSGGISDIFRASPYTKHYEER
jgi:hypothetical protein